MKYTIKGRLQTAICDDNQLAIPNTVIRIYSLNEERNAATAFATAQSKEVSKIFEEGEIKERKKFLLAETRTDAVGNFEAAISDGLKYDGGTVAVTLYYDHVPDYGQKDTKLPKNFKPFEVLLDIIQPKWNENQNGLVAAWNYTVLKRIWCYILQRLDIWVICGTLTNCESKAPLNGIEVIAMDDDIITDDLLGSAVTDDNGKFCIYYRSIKFKKTFLSPFINIETTPILSFDNGPDIYFKFAVGGSQFFAESPSEAQRPSRKNVGNCLCVSLCLKESPNVPGTVPAAFYQIGYARAYHPVLNIDPTTGRTAGKVETSWNNQAFYATMDLRGSLSKKFNGQPVEYKFQYFKVTDLSVDISSIPDASWTDVKPSDIAKSEIGTRITSFFPVIKYNSYKIHGTDAVTVYGNEIEVQFSGNWIQVPQDSGVFDIHFNGSLIHLISNNLTSGVVDKTGLVQGTTSAPLLENDYFAIRMLKRELGNEASKVQAGFSRPLAIFNTKYTNVPQGGSWLPSSSDELGIASIDLQELKVGGGCSKITDSLTINYTAANPNLGNVSLSMSGPGGPHNFEPVLYPTPGEEAFGASKYTGANNVVDPNDVINLPNCSYEVRLSATLNLTNGETQHDPIWDRVLFCK